MDLWLRILIYVMLGLAAMTVLVSLFQNGRPIRSLVGSGLQGVCALAAVNIAGIFTGISLGLNFMTFIACTALGVPGVITLLILKLIFNMP